MRNFLAVVFGPKIDIVTDDTTSQAVVAAMDRNAKASQDLEATVRDLLKENERLKKLRGKDNAQRNND